MRGLVAALAVYLAAICAPVAILAVRYMTVRAGHGRRREEFDREPRCASCGYILAHRQSPTCPECGRDVRDHGLITSRARPAIGLGPLYVLLALIALPVALFLGGLLARWQPIFGWTYQCEQMVSLQRDDGTFGFPRYAVASDGRGRKFRRPEHVWIYCNSDGNGHPMLWIDLNARKFELADAAGNKSAPKPIGVGTVADFLRSRSPEIQDKHITDAAERIVSAVQRQMTGNVKLNEASPDDPMNGFWIGDSVSTGVCRLMYSLSWVALSSVLFLLLRRLQRSARRKRQQLWRCEVERLHLFQLPNQAVNTINSGQ